MSRADATTINDYEVAHGHLVCPASRGPDVEQGLIVTPVSESTNPGTLAGSRGQRTTDDRRGIRSAGSEHQNPELNQSTETCRADPLWYVSPANALAGRLGGPAGREVRSLKFRISRWPRRTRSSGERLMEPIAVRWGEYKCELLHA